MFKSANVGSLDRMLRVLIGIVLIAVPYFYAPEILQGPTARWATLAVGIILIATALIRFCPIYRLLGINSCKVK